MGSLASPASAEGHAEPTAAAVSHEAKGITLVL